MADKFLNLTDLVAIKNWIEGKFATILNFNALEDRVEDLEDAGGEPNVIETVKVNGTALTPDANKAVNVQAAEMYLVMGGVSIDQGPVYVQIKQPDLQDPTMLAVVIDQGSGTPTTYAVPTKGYVDENGGKIDHITVNGTEQTITNKTVALTVPTVDYASTAATFGNKTTISDGTDTLNVAFKADGTQIEISDNHNNSATFFTDSHLEGVVDLWIGNALDNDGDPYQTESEVQTAIDNALADITGIDFQVVQTLPATGVKGTIYLVSNSGSGQDIYDEYIWLDGDPTGRYEKIGTTAVDLSNYWTMTSGQSNTLEAATVAEVQAILEPTNP